MTSICNPVDDLITQAADLLNATLSLVHNRLAPTPKRDATTQLVNVAKALQDTAGLFQTSSVKCKLEAEISALNQETQRFTESVDIQLREWEQQQEEQRAHAEDHIHTTCDGLFPVDVIGVIATFLPPYSDTQRPLMLVNRAWLQGVASQDGMKPKPETLNWPYAALRLRDPAMLRLARGGDRHVADLARELPRVKAVQLVASGMLRHGEQQVTDNCLLHASKLRLLTTLQIKGDYSWSPSDAGLKHLANLRQLTSLSLVNCSTVTQLGLEHFDNLTTLDITNCPKIPESVLNTSKGALRQLTTLKISCNFTDAGVGYIKTLTALTSLDLEGNLYGTPMMEAIGELSGLVSLTLRSQQNQRGRRVCAATGEVEAEEEPLDQPKKGISFLTKLKCLKSLSASELNEDDLKTICDGIPTLTSLQMSSVSGGYRHLPQLKSTLMKVGICYSEPSYEDLQHVGTLVHLTSLDLAWCGTEWTKEFAFLQNFKKLHTLNIADCNVDDEDLKFIATSLPQLTSLTLKSNPDITDAGMQHLLQGLKHLVWVDVRYCHRVGWGTRQITEARGIQLVDQDNF